MADLTCNFVGVKSPNPFWLASAPPTDKAYNVNRAFEAGWGGVVWKTLGNDPPIVNVSSRYGAIQLNGRVDYVNLSDRVLETHREPARPGPARRHWGYAATATHGADAAIAPLAAPSTRIPVTDLLP